jgi:hypothetical protein
MTTRKMLILGVYATLTLVLFSPNLEACWGSKWKSGGGSYFGRASYARVDGPIACPIGYTPVVCDGVWRAPMPGEEAIACVADELVGKKCEGYGPPARAAAVVRPGAAGCGSGLHPMVCDRRTGCWRHARCCERPLAYLPIEWHGTPCAHLHP